MGFRVYGRVDSGTCIYGLTMACLSSLDIHAKALHECPDFWVSAVRLRLLQYRLGRAVSRTLTRSV